jgi:hypothetical protein
MIFQGVGVDIAGRRVHIVEGVLDRSQHYRAGLFGCVLPIAEGSNKIFTGLIGDFLYLKFIKLCTLIKNRPNSISRHFEVERRGLQSTPAGSVDSNPPHFVVNLKENHLISTGGFLERRGLRSAPAGSVDSNPPHFVVNLKENHLISTGGFLERRGWDSNPRYLTVHALSRRAH